MSTPGTVTKLSLYAIPGVNSPSPQSLKAVIYAAKSTEDVHDSIPDQLRDCRGTAEREDWTVVGEFSDEAFSAYHGNRGPGLERAKQAAGTLSLSLRSSADNDDYRHGSRQAVRIIRAGHSEGQKLDIISAFQSYGEYLAGKIDEKRLRAKP